MRARSWLAPRAPPKPSRSLCAGWEHFSHGKISHFSLSPSAPQLGPVQEEMPRGTALTGS